MSRTAEDRSLPGKYGEIFQKVQRELQRFRNSGHEANTGPSSPVAESYEQANGALKAVLAERKRQNKKWGVQNHDLPTWHAIVSEELGEAAEAVLKRKHDADEGEKHIGHVRDEFVQVAATALQVVEYIDRVHFSTDE